MKLPTSSKRSKILSLGCAMLTLSEVSSAAVVVSFSQIGTDVVATWEGLMTPGTFRFDFVGQSNSATAATETLFVLRTGAGYDIWSGGVFENTGLRGTITATTGGAFGFAGNDFYFNGLDNDRADSTTLVFDPLVHTMTFGSTTLAAIGAGSFDNRLAWTAGGGGTNTVRYTTVIPEASSALLGCAASLVFGLRRRR